MNIYKSEKNFLSLIFFPTNKKNPAHAAKISKTKFSVLLLAVLLTTENIYYKNKKKKLEFNHAIVQLTKNKK